MDRGRSDGDRNEGCGDGYSIHGDGWRWGQVSVPVQTSTV